MKKNIIINLASVLNPVPQSVKLYRNRKKNDLYAGHRHTVYMARDWISHLFFLFSEKIRVQLSL